MSVSNVNMFEFDDAEKANEWISWFNRDGPSGFAQAEVLLFVRTGPTSGLTISVYPLTMTRGNRVLRLENFKHNKLIISEKLLSLRVMSK